MRWTSAIATVEPCSTFLNTKSTLPVTTYSRARRAFDEVDHKVRGLDHAELTVHYRLKLPAEVKSQLKSESVSIKQAIGFGLYRLQEDLSGDVKKLKGFKNKYRLRIGDYRVLFELEKDIIRVYAFGHRREIYR